MAQVVFIHDKTVEGLEMAEIALVQACADARDNGHIAMAKCLARMLTAVRAMLLDLGEG